MTNPAPRQQIEEIKNRVDIVDLIGSFISLKRQGNTFRALCPFHHEKTPSFNVNQQRQIYHCFGCGKGGDIFRFLMDHEGMDFHSALQYLAERAGIKLEPMTGSAGGKSDDKTPLYKIHEELASEYNRYLDGSGDAEKARLYLTERQLTADTIKSFLFGYAPERVGHLQRWYQAKGYPPELLEKAGLLIKSDRGNDYYERFRNRLMIPLRDELGRVVGFSGRILDKNQPGGKYVNSPETPIFRKSRILFALDRARRAIADAKLAIICEGQIDAIRCHTAGFTNVVATQGTALTDDHIRLIKRYADNVVLVLDPDEAGIKAALRGAEMFIAAGLTIRIARLPTGTDPDSLIRDTGPEPFLEAIDHAIPAVEFLVQALQKWEDLTHEAGLLRATRAIAEFTKKAPSATLKDLFIDQAIKELQKFLDPNLFHAVERGLRQDLQKLGQSENKERLARPTKPQPAQEGLPPEELGVVELLLRHPELKETATAYLQAEHFSNSSLKNIYQCLRNSVDPFSELSEEEEGIRLLSRIAIAPNKITGEETSPEHALQDFILTIRRKEAERQRAQLRDEMKTSATEEQERLGALLTQRINLLRQGWEKCKEALKE